MSAVKQADRGTCRSTHVTAMPPVETGVTSLSAPITAAGPPS